MTPRTLRLELRPSPLLASAVVGAHAAAAVCAAAALPGLPGTALAIALTALGFATAWSRALHRARRSVRAIELQGKSATLFLGSGECIAVEVAERRYVGRWLVTLPIRRPLRARRTQLICADMLPSESFRTLRIWALWGKVPPVAAEQLAA